MAKVIKVGLDFDGVIAYNPARTVRVFIKYFKRRFLGERKLHFYLPKGRTAEQLWKLIHKTSIWPAIGVEELRVMSKRKDLEFHLITGRIKILEEDLANWIKNAGLDNVFKSININENSEQPHVFKLNKINENKLDYFVEDNLDVVEYIRSKTPTKIYWIYNVIDRRHPYPDKFPHLKQALEAIGK